MLIPGKYIVPAGRNIKTIATCLTRVRILWNSPSNENMQDWHPDINTPVKNRKGNSIQTFVDANEISDVHRLIRIVVLSVRRRPHVSPRNPIKCALTVTPRNPADPRSPCSIKVN